MNQATNKRLFVGSLPYTATEEELRDLFSSYGEVESAKIISDKFTGQSKGFAFVEMVNPDDAKRAVEGLNGKPFNGRTLIVNDARPQQERDRSAGGGRGERGGGGGGGGFFRERREGGGGGGGFGGGNRSRYGSRDRG